MRIRALIKRIFQQLIRDKRTLALLLIAPLLILTLMYYLFQDNKSSNLRLGTINIDANLIDVLEKDDISVIIYENATNETLINDKLDGILKSENKSFELTLLNDDPLIAKMLLVKINQSLTAQFQKSIGSANMKLPGISVRYVYGSSIS